MKTRICLISLACDQCTMAIGLVITTSSVYNLC
jgi:hypothetical protein